LISFNFVTNKIESLSVAFVGYNMILPPITVYASNLTHVRAAVVDFVKGDFISTLNMDEQCVYVTFRNVATTPHLEEVVQDLARGITFMYQDQTYKIHTQYFDI
jgi:hypothetical protein